MQNLISLSPLLPAAYVVGQVGLETFGECTNLTSLTGQPYSSGMYECADSVVTLSYYANDTCDGDVLYSNTTSTNCTDMQRTSCTEGEGLIPRRCAKTDVALRRLYTLVVLLYAIRT